MLGNIYKNNFKPDSIAIKFKGQTVTYSELDSKVQKYATYLSKIGIKKGDKVVLSCLNSPEFIYSYLAVVKLGAIIVPINLLLTIEEMKYVIKNSEAKTMIVHPTILLKLKQSKNFKKQAIATLFENSIIRKIAKKIIGLDIILLDQKFNKKIDSISKISFEEASDDSQVSTFLYTSGTTGKPKAAMLTHKSLLTNVVQLSKTIDIYENDNFLCVLPLFHVFAFTVCSLLPLYKGATITIHEMFQPKELIESLSKDGATIFPGVPSMYIILLEALKTNVTFPNLRLAISGGAALPVEIFRQAKEKFNFPLIEGYGLSEASPVVTLNPFDGVQKEGSIGLPIYGVECKVVDENGNEVGVEETGELIVKGENVMSGYYKQEEQTKETLKDGWLYTGDMAKKDSEGYVYIVDRKKDLVIVGGFNVYPREVEEVIYAFPKVKEAAVVGIKDNLRGEYVKAFIVLKEGQTCHSRELLRYLKERLAVYKLPREIKFVDELPKNGAGKILKRVLREQYSKESNNK